MKHLSERDFQDFLDGNEIPGMSYIREHLKSCPACSRQLESYRKLYKSMEHEIPWSLPGDFADSVMEKVPKPLPVWKKYLSSDTLLIAASICLAAAVSLYYFEPGNLLGAIYQSLSKHADFSAVSRMAASVIQAFDSPGMFYLTAGLAVVLFLAAIDKFVNKFRLH